VITLTIIYVWQLLKPTANEQRVI